VVECEMNSFKNCKPCIYFLSNYLIGFFFLLKYVFSSVFQQVICR